MQNVRKGRLCGKPNRKKKTITRDTGRQDEIKVGLVSRLMVIACRSTYVLSTGSLCALAGRPNRRESQRAKQEGEIFSNKRKMAHVYTVKHFKLVPIANLVPKAALKTGVNSNRGSLFQLKTKFIKSL